MADRLRYVSQDMHWLEVALPARLITCGALRCADALPFNLSNDAFAAQQTAAVMPQHCFDCLGHYIAGLCLAGSLQPYMATMMMCCTVLASPSSSHVETQLYANVLTSRRYAHSH